MDTGVASVCVGLDGRAPGRGVMCYDDDRTLACRVAKTSLAKLRSLGMQVIDAVVEVKSSRGKKLGDRDLTLGTVRADVPARLCPRLPLSCEVKLRRIRYRPLPPLTSPNARKIKVFEPSVAVRYRP